MPSTAIDHYHYHKDTQCLVITFLTGKIYLYEAVPEKVFKLFKAAISKGKYFNYHIKNKYKFKQLEE